ATEAKEVLQSAIEKNELDEICAKKDALQEIVQQLTVKLYEQAQAAAGQAEGAQGAPDAGAKKDNVVDADFEEVKEDK
ncbi:molecular chaperone DnaK, partial [Bacillus thuringiensis]